MRYTQVEKRGPAVEAAEAPDHGDERLLGGIEGVGVVAGDAAAHQVDLRLVGAQEAVEGTPITVLGGSDEPPLIVERGHRGHGATVISATVAWPDGATFVNQTSTWSPRTGAKVSRVWPASAESTEACGSPQPARSPGGAPSIT